MILVNKETTNTKEKTVLIEITEGCTCYSYLINGIEWVELTDPTSKDYTTNHNDIINDVHNALVGELLQQYYIPAFLTDNLYDNESDDYEYVPCTQDTFVNLVKSNNRTKKKYLGTCDECGDTIYKYTLILKV